MQNCRYGQITLSYLIHLCRMYTHLHISLKWMALNGQTSWFEFKVFELRVPFQNLQKVHKKPGFLNYYQFLNYWTVFPLTLGESFSKNKCYFVNVLFCLWP